MSCMDAYNLSNFGWDHTKIPANLLDICKHLPRWDKLKFLRNPQYVGSHEIYFPHSYLHDISGNEFMPAFEKGTLHNDNGGYAQIYKSKRAIYTPIGDKYGNVRLTRTCEFSEICIKEVHLHVDPDEGVKGYEDEINAILYEAYLHALICKTLERFDKDLVNYVPHLFEVLSITSSGEIAKDVTEIESIWMSMEFLEGTTLEKFLRKVFHENSKETNTAILKDILIQLAFLLNVLQDNLQFNHRDMKINNVFVRVHPEGTWSRKVPIPGIEHVYECKVDIVLLDFGFSCIACGSGFTNPRATLLGAGSFFRPDDDCMKRGRDLAQFLYSLHCCFPLQEFILPGLFDILHDAILAERNGKIYDLWMGVDAAGNPLVHTILPKSIKYNNGIYYFLRDNCVNITGCEPQRLLQKLLGGPVRAAGGAGAV